MEALEGGLISRAPIDRRVERKFEAREAGHRLPVALAEEPDAGREDSSRESQGDAGHARRYQRRRQCGRRVLKEGPSAGKGTVEQLRRSRV